MSRNTTESLDTLLPLEGREFARSFAEALARKMYEACCSDDSLVRRHTEGSGRTMKPTPWDDCTDGIRFAWTEMAQHALRLLGGELAE